MTRLTDGEILDRHRQSLSEGREACRQLARFADPELLELKGGHYKVVKDSLDKLIGTCRQLASLRSDTRWTRLSAVYSRARIAVQNMYAAGSWWEFGKLASLFELGERRLAELDMKTGVVGRAILPQRASEWLVMPPLRPLIRPVGRTLH
jgi:hypothetical protein